MMPKGMLAREKCDFGGIGNHDFRDIFVSFCIKSSSRNVKLGLGGTIPLSMIFQSISRYLFVFVLVGQNNDDFTSFS